MLRETILADTHRELNGKLVDFGGWAMPLHYGSQIEEHHCVRQTAGMFDVSHMTVVDVSGEQAQAYLQKLLANDVALLKSAGKALYSVMLNERGGVIDDLIVYRLHSGFRLVVNCATREKDLAWMNAQAEAFNVSINERDELAIIAVQGPEARTQVDAVLKDEAVSSLDVFFGAHPEKKPEWFVARTGYTGEDGYEIILPSNDALQFWQELLAVGVKPCGLGARDTLRLEAGMNLYGHEMDEHTSPLVANLGWTLAWEPPSRNFIGREALVSQRETGIHEKLVGLVLQGKGVLRAEQKVSHEDVPGDGVITSGTYSPSLGQSVALARVPTRFSGPDFNGPSFDGPSFNGQCLVTIRNKLHPASIVRPCFVRHGKKVF